MSKSKDSILKTSNEGLWNTDSYQLPATSYAILAPWFSSVLFQTPQIRHYYYHHHHHFFCRQCFRFVYHSLSLIFLLAFSDLPFDIIFLLLEVHLSQVT